MKVFTHGSSFNFQESAREMFITDLDQLIHSYQEDTKKIMLGTINLGKGEVHFFGHLQAVYFDEENGTCELHFNMMTGEERRVSYSLKALTISHDAVFEVFEEGDQKVTYQVLYVTFQKEEDETETTYFLAKEDVVKEPLAYVAEFWQQVSEVGRDVDFTVAGCRTKAFIGND